MLNREYIKENPLVPDKKYYIVIDSNNIHYAKYIKTDIKEEYALFEINWHDMYHMHNRIETIRCYMNQSQNIFIELSTAKTHV